MALYPKTGEEINGTHAPTRTPTAGTGPGVAKVLCDAERGHGLATGQARVCAAGLDRSPEVFTHMGKEGGLTGSSGPGENLDVTVVTVPLAGCLFSYGSPGSRAGSRCKRTGEGLKSTVIRLPDLW